MATEETHLSKKITQGYTFKILLLIFLILLLLIPLTMIRGLIRDRHATANSAESEIMEAWGARLIEAGPVIMIPGVKTEEVRTKTEREGEKIEFVKTPFTLVVTPRKLDIEARLETTVRKRGIFSVPLFSGELALSGNFNAASAIADLPSNEELSLGQAELIIALSSQKGIRKINVAMWNDRDLFFQPGNRGQHIIRTDSGRGGGTYGAIPDFKDGESAFNIGGGIYAAIPDLTGGESAFTISIAIQGGQYARFLPIGQDTHVTISADWAAPSFQGSFLPNSATITENGFDAVWDISYLSRDIPLVWKYRGEYFDRDYSGSLFGVNFFRAIDTYSLNTRAVKYAILFLIVPFLTLFLLEIFARKRVHPVPYLLAGIGNVIFYLLLLSLSEQMRFYLAYLIAASSVTVMMTFYSRALLPSWNKSWYMGLTVMLSYILLYAVLNAESYALLIGSIGAFVVVALVMFLTRKLNWYGQES